MGIRMLTQHYSAAHSTSHELEESALRHRLTMSHNSFAAAFLSGLLVVAPAATQAGAYDAEIAATEKDLAEASKTASVQGQSLVGALAAARAEQLKLTLSMLRNLDLIEAGAAPTEIVVPRLLPDPEKEKTIQAELDAAEAELQAAQKEAERYSGGLVLAMIISRQETARLQIAQLNSALIEARYGIPMTVAGLKAAAVTASNAPNGADAHIDSALDTKSSDQLEGAEHAPPSWADPEHPEIDYAAAPFDEFSPEDYRFFGWWAIQETHAEIDDSKQIVAINLSAITSGYGSPKLLIMQCREREKAVVFRPGAYLMIDYETHRVRIAYRIDGAKVHETLWSGLTDNQGAGAFGSNATSVMGEMATAQKVFFRLTEDRGEQHDASFNLAGTDKVVEAIEAECD
jgi:hypothetical protein